MTTRRKSKFAKSLAFSEDMEEVQTQDSWEEVRYRRVQARKVWRDGRPEKLVYKYLLDDDGDWHKHHYRGWHKVSRKHWGPGGYHKHGYYGRHPVSRKHSIESGVM